MKISSTWIARPAALALAMLALAWLQAAACSTPAPREPARLRISSGPRGATYFILSDAIASVYNRVTAEQAATVIESGGATSNIDAIEAGDAECGLATAGSTYPAYSEGTARIPSPHAHLRGVAVLFPNVLHVVATRTSLISSLADLAQARIALATPSLPVPSRRAPLSMALLDVARGMAPGQMLHADTIELSLADAVAAVRAGNADAAFFSGGYPFQPVTQLADAIDLVFIEFDEAAVSLVKEQYPFFKPVVIPPGTYHGQARAVRTVAVDNLLVCRDTLPADTVYRLTRAVHESVAYFASIHPSGREINVEDGPSTPIPLHTGAARYYRERELFR